MGTPPSRSLHFHHSPLRHTFRPRHHAICPPTSSPHHVPANMPLAAPMPPTTLAPAKRPRTASHPRSRSLAPPRKLEDYTIHRVIGTGGSATVLRAAPVDAPDAPVALKALAKRGLSRRAQRYLAREIAIHRSVAAHPHIVALKDAFENRHGIYLVMDLLRGGDLYALLKKEKRPLSPVMALVILGQIVDALTYLHARGISHRDLKLENVMFARPLKRTKAQGLEPVTQRYQIASVNVQVVDFGLACARDPSSQGDARLSRESCGTKNYCAPEVLRARHAPYSPEAADMWSCGVVLYAMLTRRLPFNDAGQGEGFAGTGEGVELKFDTPELRKVPDGVLALLKELLNVDPAKRPTASETLAAAKRLLEEDEVRRQPRAVAAFVRDGRKMGGGGFVGLGDGRKGKALVTKDIEVLVEGAHVADACVLGPQEGGNDSAEMSGNSAYDTGGATTDPDLSLSSGGGMRHGKSSGKRRSADGMESLASEESGGDVAVKSSVQQPMPFNLGFLRGVFDLFSFGNNSSENQRSSCTVVGKAGSTTSNEGECSVDGDDGNGGDDEAEEIEERPACQTALRKLVEEAAVGPPLPRAV